MLIGVIGLYQHQLERIVSCIENVRIIKHETQVSIDERRDAILTACATITYDIEAFLNSDIYSDAIVITQTPYNVFDVLTAEDRKYIDDIANDVLNYDALIFVVDGPKSQSAKEYIRATEVPMASLANVILGIREAMNESL